MALTSALSTKPGRNHIRCPHRPCARYVQSLDDGSCNLLAVYEYKVSTNPDKDTETHTSTHTKMYHCRMELNSSGTMWLIAEQYFDTAVTGDLAYDVADYLTGMASIMTKNAVSTSSYHGLGNKSIVLRILIILFGFLFFWFSSYLFPNGNAYLRLNRCQYRNCGRSFT